MKKLFALMLTVLLLVSFCSCGKDIAVPDTTKETVVTTEAETTYSLKEGEYLIEVNDVMNIAEENPFMAALTDNWGLLNETRNALYTIHSLPEGVGSGSILVVTRADTGLGDEELMIYSAEIVKVIK